MNEQLTAQHIQAWSIDALSTSSKHDMLFHYKEFINVFVLSEYCDDEHVVALDEMIKIDDKMYAIIYINDVMHEVELNDDVSLSSLMEYLLSK